MPKHFAFRLAIYGLRMPFTLAIATQFIVALAMYTGAFTAAAGIGLTTAAIAILLGRKQIRNAWVFTVIVMQLQLPLLALTMAAASFANSDAVSAAVVAEMRDTFYITSLAGSGPLGIAVTMTMDFNFPYDHNWRYAFALWTATALQWSFFWWVATAICGHYRHRWECFLCTGMLITVLLGISLLIHLGVTIGSRT